MWYRSWGQVTWKENNDDSVRRNMARPGVWQEGIQQ